jgi:hypothetical protein
VDTVIRNLRHRRAVRENKGEALQAYAETVKALLHLSLCGAHPATVAAYGRDLAAAKVRVLS